MNRRLINPHIFISLLPISVNWDTFESQNFFNYEKNNIIVSIYSYVNYCFRK